MMASGTKNEASNDIWKIASGIKGKASEGTWGMTYGVYSVR